MRGAAMDGRVLRSEEVAGCHRNGPSTPLRYAQGERCGNPLAATYTGRMTLKVILQYLLPHRFLSRLVYWGTRWTFAPWKNWLISTVVRTYGVDMAEAAQPDPLAYQHFNAFFTRKLRPDARHADADPKAVISPADG